MMIGTLTSYLAQSNNGEGGLNKAINSVLIEYGSYFVHNSLQSWGEVAGLNTSVYGILTI